MIRPLLGFQLARLSRNRRSWAVALVVLAMCGVAAIEGWNRSRAAAEARAAAEVGDRANWVNQGPNNPHGAAHFARYAFRPAPALAAFDPGVQDYAGAAIWLEAHYQDPPTLRRVEVLPAHSPIESLSASWLLCIIGTLAWLVLLAPAVAGEREHKTMRALLVAGVSPGSFITAKVGAAMLAITGLTIAALSIALLPATFILIDAHEEDDGRTDELTVTVEPE